MASQKIVYVLSTIPNLARLVSQKLPDIECRTINIKENCLQKDEKVIEDSSINELRHAEIVLIDNGLLGQVVDFLPNLKWAQGTWAGVEIVATQFKNKPLPNFCFTRMGNQNFSQLMAEYTIGWIINHERSFLQVHQNKLNGDWVKDGKANTYRSFSELTVSILGIGTIGKEIARLLKAFHCTVHGCGRSPAPKNLQDINIDKYWQTHELPELLECCDYVVSVLPSTLNTNNILGNSVLQNAKNKPVLINIGRGNIIKEEEIIRALDSNWISAAVLDVFEEEPLPKSSKLWEHPKVVITPHVAGMSRSVDVAEAFVTNWKRLNESSPLLNQMNWNRGY